MKPGDLVTIQRPDVRFKLGHVALVMRVFNNPPARPRHYDPDIPGIEVAEVLPIGWHERITYIIKDLKVYKSA